MKKFFTLIVGGGALLIAFSASALTTTAENLAKYEARFKEAKTPYGKAGNEVNIYFYNGKNKDPQTHAEMKQIIESIYAKHGLAADSNGTRTKIYQQAALTYKQFRMDAWKELSVKKDSWFWMVKFITKNYANLAVEEQFDLLSEALCDVNCSLDPKSTREAVEKLIKISSSIKDEAKVKSVLKTLNRKYSPNLIKDKANWEPIVAQIRTALETY